MARYDKRNYDIRDVHQVARLYNQVWRDYTGFPESARPSDSDLWQHGKPTLSQEGTVSEGEARLVFTFQGYTEHEAEHWVKKFVRANKLPHTDIEVKPSRNLRGLINYEPGEEIPTYVRVIVKFQIHPKYRDAFDNP